MASRRGPSVWTKLENFNGEKFPECVKSILLDAGYNTFNGLRQINEQEIRIIEAFIQKEHVEKLNCCYHEFYKNLDVFIFLPGHKSIIMAIPSQIDKLFDAKKHTKQNTNQRI